MGPSYQGATMSLRLIKFSTAMHLSGTHRIILEVQNTTLVPRQTARPAKVITVRASPHTGLVSLKTMLHIHLALYFFMAAITEN